MEAKAVGKIGLTIEKLRTFKGLEKLSEQEAQKVIESIRRFSKIMLRLYYQLKKKQNRNEVK